MDFEQDKEYTVKSLNDFLLDQGDAHDWDFFTSTTSRFVELEKIRRVAMLVELPLDDEGREVLQDLLQQTKALEASERTSMLHGRILWLLVIGIAVWVAYVSFK